MMLLVSYLLKVIVCSGILFLYYHLALRNKLFHQWNRFYLLTAAILSLLIPVVQITISHRVEQQKMPIQLLQVVGSANDYLDEVTIGGHHSTSPEMWAAIGYSIISVVLLFSLIFSLLRILAIVKKYGAKHIMSIKFINTDVAGTPFSFFRYIFWNKDIDLESEDGQRIFEHELVHVREKHTIDKLLMETIIILFWCNPFFWFIRRELKMIHEFIADQKAVGEEGAAAFATMILHASYTKQFHSITNQFFQTSIKRRLQMITRIQNPKLSYFSRIIALPVLAIVVLAFTFRTKEVLYIKLDKTFTVVIDAGHGFMSDDKASGAQVNDINEADLNLSIAKKIQELNPNEQVKIILTRSGRDNVDLKQRVFVAQEAKADLFISIHVNAAPPEVLNDPSYAAKQNEFEGMDITVSNKQTPYQQQSELFGSVLEKELESIYKVSPQLQKRKVGTWVLDQNVCPSVLLECGYITNDKDRQFMSNEFNQKVIAEHILSAIQQYAKVKESGSLPLSTSHIRNDTTPKQYYKGNEVISVNVNKQREKIYITTNDGKVDSMSGEQARKYNFNAPPPIYIVDGKEFGGDINTIDSKTIQSVNVLKGDAAIKSYGDKGKNGVVQITLKKINSQQPAQEKKGVDISMNDNEKAPAPLYILDGKEFRGPVNSLNSNDIESINVLKGDAAIKQYGDKGKNGVVEITLKNNGGKTTTQDNNAGTIKEGLNRVNTVANPSLPEHTPLFEQAETHASVNMQEWKRFLVENLKPVIEDVSKNAPDGQYTTKIRFIVEQDGRVSSGKVIEDPGFGIGNRVLGIMDRSPRWEPAVHNGKKVRSYHTQPITFTIKNTR